MVKLNKEKGEIKAMHADNWIGTNKVIKLTTQR